MFSTRNLFGDPMVNIYLKGDIMVDYSPPYEYIEIFGLSDEEFDEIDNEINGK